MSLIQKSSNQDVRTLEAQFKELLQIKIEPLLNAIRYIIKQDSPIERISRPVLDQLFTQSAAVEEFMDLSGAKTNNQFSLLRSKNANIKNFSRIYYKLLHIECSLGIYSLLELTNDFQNDLTSTIKTIHSMLLDSCYTFNEACNSNDIKLPIVKQPEYLDTDVNMIANILPSNINLRHEESPAVVVVAIATDFLNLAENNSISNFSKIENYKNTILSLVPEFFSAEKLRTLETYFHNMQSKYDTCFAATDIATIDKSLQRMRGLISVIYHLLIIATYITHYYQRHYLNNESNHNPLNLNNNVMFKNITNITFFSISYINLYREASRNICREIIAKYTQKTTITLSPPSYRGFHVRPATLISRIILHYGSEVNMKFCDLEYNASIPFNLFRANEELNARKRKILFDYIANSKTMSNRKNLLDLNLIELKNIIRSLFWELSDKNQIIIYEPTLNFNDIEEKLENENCLDFAKRIVQRYIALGKIDAETQDKVVFYGDERVLADIKILAEHGYGEDKYGNNIILPPPLDYLRYSLV